MTQQDLERVRVLLETIAAKGTLVSMNAGLVRASDHLEQGINPVWLTSEGREFLEAAHDEIDWSYTKRIATLMGGIKLSTAEEVLFKQARSKVTHQARMAKSTSLP